VSAELLADRFASTGPALTTAERAAADRTWTYGHVVVDEAQELSPMAWRMVLRRVPTRSLTVVGDVAQTSTAAGTRDWAATFDRALPGGWRLAELTVNYRTPASVARTAERVGRAAGLPLSPTTSARDVEDALRTEHVDAAAVPEAVARHAAEALAAVRDASGAGRVAVIAAPEAVAALAAVLPDAGGTRAGSPDLDAPLTLMTPTQSKGLEFDVVVLVEPADVLKGGAGDLYVAMTRPTQALHVVHARPLPAGWDA
jgi:superfamily I DNA/RNA helicase